jgi:hypothetical protein
MRRDPVAWERAAEVRQAAEGWLRASAIDAPTHEAIRRAYPDPCVTPSVVWRALTAVLVSAVVLCIVGAVGVATEPGSTGFSLMFFVFGGVSLAATELLEASPRHARRGAAGATAFWGSLFLLLALGLFLLDGARVKFDRAIDAILLAGALVWGVGCWRWGHELFAGLSAVSLFVYLGRFLHGRVLWVLVGLALVGLAARRLDTAAWAPSHRRSAMVVLLVAVAAMYVAVNVYSLETSLLEELRPFAPSHVASRPGLLVVTAVATALLPLLVLGWALRSRRTLLLDAGIVLLALSLVTLRYYLHVAPVWVVLTASGAGLVGLALVVERALRRGPGGVRAGFTADVLFSDERRQHALQTLPVVAAFTPAASAAAVEDKGFAGHGGAFGGGGASDKY